MKSKKRAGPKQIASHEMRMGEGCPALGGGCDSTTRKYSGQNKKAVLAPKQPDMPMRMGY